MRKCLYFVISIFAVLLLVGCENANEEVIKNNTNQQQETIQLNSEVICKGPIVDDVFESLDDVITNDSMKMVAEYDGEEKLIGITYIYEIDFAVMVSGEQVDTLSSSIKKICDKKEFSACDTDISSERAIIEAEVDIDNSKKFKKYTKDDFRKDMKSLGDGFYCLD